MSGRDRRPPLASASAVEILRASGDFAHGNEVFRAWKMFFERLILLKIHPTQAAITAVRLLELDLESKRVAEADGACPTCSPAGQPDSEIAVAKANDDEKASGA